MSTRGLGVLLVWIGALLLVAVLQQRMRSGAWSRDAFDNPPPVEKWAAPITIAGLIAAAAGAGLALWSFR